MEVFLLSELEELRTNVSDSILFTPFCGWLLMRGLCSTIATSDVLIVAAAAASSASIGAMSSSASTFTTRRIGPTLIAYSICVSAAISCAASIVAVGMLILVLRIARARVCG